jgi:hypothetical protein
MIEAQNPHAAFTLLRAYAENTAAILYAGSSEPGRPPKRFEGFKGIYDQLSKFARPQALGVLGMSVESRA